jgi:hypothetical protein
MLSSPQTVENGIPLQLRDGRLKKLKNIFLFVKLIKWADLQRNGCCGIAFELMNFLFFSICSMP